MANNNIKKLVDKLPKLKKVFDSMAKMDCYVGVPSAGTERKENGPTNAMIAYINDNGSPAQNIPARPFMRPGIESAKPDIIKVMKIGAKKGVGGDKEANDVALHQIGIIGQRAIRAAINEGIPPPLADSTLRARIRAKRGAKGATAELERRKSGEQPSSTASAKPLINTGQLRNSINYVIRKKK